MDTTMRYTNQCLLSLLMFTYLQSQRYSTSSPVSMQPATQDNSASYPCQYAI